MSVQVGLREEAKGEAQGATRARFLLRAAAGIHVRCHWLSLSPALLASALQRWVLLGLTGVVLACAHPLAPSPWRDPLTPAERSYVASHGPIRYAPDPQFPPFESLSASRTAQGITPDILAILGRRLHVSFVTIACSSWPACLQAVREGRADLLGTVSKTSERGEYLAFTRPYFDMPYVLFIRAGGPAYRDFGGLAGRRVGVVKDYLSQAWLIAHHPEIIAVPEPNLAAGLRQVATGRLDAVFESMPVGLSVLRANGITNVTVASPILLEEPQYLAVAKDNTLLLDILQKGLAELPHRDLSGVFTRWTGLDLTEAPWRMGIRVKTALLVLLLLALAAGAWVAVLQHTVARKTRELRQKEERLRLLLERNLAGVYRTTAGGRFLECNEAFAKLLGYPSREAVLTINAAEIYFDPSERQSAVERTLRATETTGETLRLKRRDGSTLWILANETLIEAPGEEPVMEGVVVDITARMEAERSIQEAHRFTQEVLDNIPANIAVLGEQGLVLAVNESWRRFGRENSPVPVAASEEGSDYLAVCDRAAACGDETASVCAGAIRRVLAGEQDSFTFDYPCSSPDRQRWFMARFVRLLGAGEPMCLVLHVEITERKRAEEALRQAELDRERARNTEYLGHLVQGLAHEVRNPLFAIELNAEVLGKRASALPGANQAVSFLREHVGRLDALMHDLLALGSQPAADQVVECRLRDVAAGTVSEDTFHEAAESGRLLVEAPGDSFAVRAMPGRLQLVLHHLVQNALQHSPPSGEVRVRVRKAGIWGELAVSDQGPGLPKAIRERLFEPFVTTNRGQRGLGLALAKHYVTTMGGTIEAIDNDPLPGATFTIRLPLANGGAEFTG